MTRLTRRRLCAEIQATDQHLQRDRERLAALRRNCASQLGRYPPLLLLGCGAIAGYVAARLLRRWPLTGPIAPALQQLLRLTRRGLAL